MAKIKKVKKVQKIDADIAALKTAKDSDLKVRITTFIDGDVYLKLQKLAKKHGTKYQTLLNDFLRKSVLNEKDDFEEIMQKLNQIEQKIAS